MSLRRIYTGYPGVGTNKIPRPELVFLKLTEQYTEILEVSLFAFVNRLFHEDFSPIYEASEQYFTEAAFNFKCRTACLPLYFCESWVIHTKLQFKNKNSVTSFRLSVQNSDFLNQK